MSQMTENLHQDASHVITSCILTAATLHNFAVFVTNVPSTEAPCIPLSIKQRYDRIILYNLQWHCLTWKWMDCWISVDEWTDGQMDNIHKYFLCS